MRGKTGGTPSKTVRKLMATSQESARKVNAARRGIVVEATVDEAANGRPSQSLKL